MTETADERRCLSKLPDGRRCLWDEGHEGMCEVAAGGNYNTAFYTFFSGDGHRPFPCPDHEQARTDRLCTCNVSPEQASRLLGPNHEATCPMYRSEQARTGEWVEAWKYQDALKVAEDGVKAYEEQARTDKALAGRYDALLAEVVDLRERLAAYEKAGAVQEHPPA